MFVDGFPQGGVGGTLGAFNEAIAPQVSDRVFCPHNYAGTPVKPVKTPEMTQAQWEQLWQQVQAAWRTRFTTRLENFNNTAQALNCPMIVDEFGIGLVGSSIEMLTQTHMDYIFNELNRVGAGGMCWVYWPGSDPLHRMVDGTGNLTANYGQLYMNSRRKVYGY